MVRLNLGHVDDKEISSSGEPVPPGQYVCEVIRAEEKHTAAALPYFNYALKIVEGEHEKRIAAFDKLFFHSDAVLKRAKFALRRMGFDVDQEEMEVEATDLNGRFVVVTIVHKPKCPSCKWDVEGAETKGLMKCKNQSCTWVGKPEETKLNGEVAWDGYAEYTGAARTPSDQDTSFDPAKIDGEKGAADPVADDDLDF